MARHRIHSSRLWLGLLSLSLAGCANGGPGGICGGGQYWESDGIRTIGEGALIGGAIGGLAGGLGSRGNAGITVLAAAGGAAIGAGIGCAVNASKSAFAAKEDSYDRQLAEMQRLNDDLRSKIASLEHERSQLAENIANLRRQQMLGQASHAQAQALMNDAQKKLDTARELLAAARKDLQKEDTLVAKTATSLGAASKEARDQREQRDSTRRLVAELNSQVYSLSASTGQFTPVR